MSVLAVKVKTVVQEEQTPNSYTVDWDGTNIKGEPVGRGIYFVIVKTAGKEIRKVVVK